MKKKETAWIVMRERTPIAICEVLDDADDLVGRYNQEMKERGVDVTFHVITTPFYPE